MTESAQTFISDALGLLGVLAEGMTASDSQGAHGLTVLNRMMDSWKIDRLTALAITRSVYALTANTQLYTIGSGATFNQVRPNWIDDARIIPDSTLAATQRSELPCEILTPERWAATVIKGEESTFPYALYYNRGFDTNERGSIEFWPIPTGANVQVVLYWPAPFDTFAAIGTQYKFAPGYAEAILYHLTKRLAPTYGKSLPEELQEMIASSKGLLEQSNLTIRELSTDSALRTVGGYDIRSGQVY